MELKELDLVRARISMQEGLLAYLLYSLKLEESKTISSAATNGQTLFVNPKFWDTLSLNHKVGLVLHELLHIVFEHSWAFGQVSEKYQPLFNLVSDVVVNKVLLRNGYVVPESGYSSFEQLGFPELDDEDVLERTTIWFYEQIIERCPKIKILSVGGNDSKEVEIRINSVKLRLKNQCIEEGEMTKDEIKGMLENAAAMCKSLNIGNMSSNLITYIEQFVRTKTNWRTVLKSYFKIVNEEELSYSKLKQRGRILRPTLKALYPNGVNIVMIIDSSGSISDDTLRKFACEIYTLMQDVSSEIYLIVNDADIELEKLITDVNEIPKKFPGRGGTVFQKAFERLNKYISLDDFIVLVLTDGEIFDLEKLSAPNYDVIWAIVNNEEFKPPFGRVVYINYN